ncbi:MAG: hypothetical protein HZB76_07405 [Chlamydiae bacterium]|nr:hypothetical protein [Chlamydiota bacterium]
MRGGSADDTFLFKNNSSISGTLTLGTGVSVLKTLQYDTSYTNSVSVNLRLSQATGINGFAPNGITDIGNITEVIGGSNVNNFLSSPNSTWNITGVNSGDVDLIIFSNFNNLIGGPTTDIFNINTGGQVSTITSGNGNNTYNLNGGDVTSSITGGTQNDIFVFSDNLGISGQIILPSSGGIKRLDYSAYSSLNPVSINLQTGAVTGVYGLNPGGISDTTKLTDIIAGQSVNDTITGFDLANTWHITANYVGTINGITFSNFEYLRGGSNNDLFIFDGQYQVTSIDGRGGSNQITGPMGAVWDVNANNAGTITTSAANPFQNIQILQGGSDNTFTVSANMTTINLGGGVNSFTIGGGTVTNVQGSNGSNSYYLNDGTITTLVGGTNVDNFYFNGSNVTNGIDGGSGDSTLFGPNTINTWNVDSLLPKPNSLITTTNTVRFSNIKNLIGGSVADNFYFNNTGSLLGIIDGNNSANNYLDYSAYTAGGITIDIPNHSATATNGIYNIQNFRGTGNINDTFNGPNVSAIWTVTATDGATVTGDVQTYTIADIANWNGGSIGDTFIMNESVGINVSGVLNDSAGKGILDYSSYNLGIYVDFSEGRATGIGPSIYPPEAGHISGFDEVTAGNGGELIGGAGNDTFRVINGISFVDGRGGINTLIGPNENKVWNITGSNSGNIVADQPITFINIQNLVGGNFDDTFMMVGSGNLNGYIDGGGGFNTLDYSEWGSEGWVNVFNHTAAGMLYWNNIQEFIGANVLTLELGKYYYTQNFIDFRDNNYKDLFLFMEYKDDLRTVISKNRFGIARKECLFPSFGKKIQEKVEK